MAAHRANVVSVIYDNYPKFFPTSRAAGEFAASLIRRTKQNATGGSHMHLDRPYDSSDMLITHEHFLKMYVHFTIFFACALSLA